MYLRRNPTDLRFLAHQSFHPLQPSFLTTSSYRTGTTTTLSGLAPPRQPNSPIPLGHDTPWTRTIHRKQTTHQPLPPLLPLHRIFQNLSQAFQSASTLITSRIQLSTAASSLSSIVVEIASSPTLPRSAPHPQHCPIRLQRVHEVSVSSAPLSPLTRYHFLSASRTQNHTTNVARHSFLLRLLHYPSWPHLSPSISTITVPRPSHRCKRLAYSPVRITTLKRHHRSTWSTTARTASTAFHYFSIRHAVFLSRPFPFLRSSSTTTRGIDCQDCALSLGLCASTYLYSRISGPRVPAG